MATEFSHRPLGGAKMFSHQPLDGEQLPRLSCLAAFFFIIRFVCSFLCPAEEFLFFISLPLSLPVSFSSMIVFLASVSVVSLIFFSLFFSLLFVIFHCLDSTWRALACCGTVTQSSTFTCSSDQWYSR